MVKTLCWKIKYDSMISASGVAEPGESWIWGNHEQPSKFSFPESKQTNR